MPLLTQGKTNWKYILITAILAVIVGGGILWLFLIQEFFLYPYPTRRPLPILILGEEVVISGLVVENVLDCVVDGDCYLRLRVNGQQFNVIYSPGWTSCPNIEAVNKAIRLWKNSRVEVFGKVIGKTEISTCDSEEYYIKVLDNRLEEDKNSDWKTYRNEEYGFEITLLDSWEGYSVLVESWSGVTLDGKSTIFQGPEILIRNPKWTEDNPWQDIPIMVFTHEEWELVEARNLNVSAAPIGPSKLGENQKYVFALPPRWVGFYDAPGQDEAKKIVETFRAF